MNVYEMNPDDPGLSAEIDAFIEQGFDTPDALAEQLGSSREFAAQQLAQRKNPD
jgi:hypothetical protein